MSLTPIRRTRPPMDFARPCLDFTDPSLASGRAWMGRRSIGMSLRNIFGIRDLGNMGRAKTAKWPGDKRAERIDAYRRKAAVRLRTDKYAYARLFVAVRFADRSWSALAGLANVGPVYGPVWEMRFWGQNGKKVRFVRFGPVYDRKPTVRLSSPFCGANRVTAARQRRPTPRRDVGHVPEWAGWFAFFRHFSANSPFGGRRESAEAGYKRENTSKIDAKWLRRRMRGNNPDNLWP
jgi:hypothetical protein